MGSCKAVSYFCFSSRGDSLSSGVGANDDVAFEVSDSVGALSFCDLASSAASLMEMADAFLRVLKENFLGGANELRMFWSFSERDLIVFHGQIY